MNKRNILLVAACFLAGFIGCQVAGRTGAGPVEQARAAQPAPAQDTVRAHRFELVDMQGRSTAVIEAFGRSGIEAIDGGVYIQTNGPRLETRAEVRMLSSFGDVVGMNLGSECTISCEMGVPFAGINTVDNYANGIVDQTLDYRDIITSAEERWKDLKRVLLEVPGIISQRWPSTDATK